MIASISVQTLANVPSAAAAAADEAADEAVDDADDTVDDVEPPQAVTPIAIAADAHVASTTFAKSTTPVFLSSGLRAWKRIVGQVRGRRGS